MAGNNSVYLPWNCRFEEIHLSGRKMSLTLNELESSLAREMAAVRKNPGLYATYLERDRLPFYEGHTLPCSVDRISDSGQATRLPYLMVPSFKRRKVMLPVTTLSAFSNHNLLFLSSNLLMVSLSSPPLFVN